MTKGNNFWEMAWTVGPGKSNTKEEGEEEVKLFILKKERATKAHHEKYT